MYIYNAMPLSLLRILWNILRALFCVRSHIISQKDVFQTLDWLYEVSWSKNMLLNVVFSHAFRWSSIYYTEP